MSKPSIILVDDDPQVLQAVERDMAAHYRADYRILRASSGDEALRTLHDVEARGDNVALMISDQKMPEMTGVELLTKARAESPLTRRVLLTAYADTEDAIRAINDARLDFYLTKPYDDPSTSLYPVVDDLLETWKSEHAQWAAQHSSDYAGIKIIGHRWSNTSHELKDMLARNQVPYKWLDLERDDEAKQYLETQSPRAPCLPVVIFPDGDVLEEPTFEQVSEKAGLQTKAGQPFYDLVIVGGGPTGLAAAVYGASEGLKTLLVEKEAPGGQAGTSSRIENYLGFPSGLSGADLARRAVAQARRFGVEILAPQSAKSLVCDGSYKRITLGDDSEIACHALLIATGVAYRRLDVPGAKKYEGAGVYYGAAITEALSCQDEEVFVIGGANSAGQGAMYLSQYASRVTILVRGESLEKSMSKYLIDQIDQTHNIHVRTLTEIVSVEGGEKIEAVVLRDACSGEDQTCPTSSVFVFIGAEPHTEWLGDSVRRDKNGFILTGPDLLTSEGKRPEGWSLKRDPYLLETSVPGVFAAGDVRHGAMRRVAAGVGTGSMSVQLIHEYLADVR